MVSKLAIFYIDGDFDCELHEKDRIFARFFMLPWRLSPYCYFVRRVRNNVAFRFVTLTNYVG